MFLISCQADKILGYDLLFSFAGSVSVVSLFSQKNYVPHIMCIPQQFLVSFWRWDSEIIEINPSLSFSMVDVNLSLNLQAGEGEVNMCCTSFSWDNIQPAKENIPCGTPAPSALPDRPPAEPGPQPPPVPMAQYDIDTVKLPLLAEKWEQRTNCS